ncbi:MAG: hypothetical protein ACI8R9_001473 [Paraglaciecola sp.]|jgi:hypothetical protein
MGFLREQAVRAYFTVSLFTMHFANAKILFEKNRLVVASLKHMAGCNAYNSILFSIVIILTTV